MTKQAVPPPVPPCAVCGMPHDLMSTRAHSREHRRIDRVAGRDRKAREREAKRWLGSKHRDPWTRPKYSG